MGYNESPGFVDPFSEGMADIQNLLVLDLERIIEDSRGWLLITPEQIGRPG